MNLYQIDNDSPAVKSAVKYVTDKFNAAGIPVDVKYDTEPLIFPGGTGLTSYTVTFSAAGKSYTATSGLLAYFVSVSVVEMQSLGMLPR